MASIFTPSDGGVLAVRQTGGAVSADSFVTIDDSDGAITLPVTGFDLELSTSHQFLHTLDKFIYVYSFGDRIGTYTVSGLGFSDCNNAGLVLATPSGGQVGGSPDENHPKGIYAYYIKNRLGTGTGGSGGKLEPTKIRMPGGRILLGFLTGFKTSVPNPAHPIVQWALRYNVIIGQSGGAGA